MGRGVASLPGTRPSKSSAEMIGSHSFLYPTRAGPRCGLVCINLWKHSADAHITVDLRAFNSGVTVYPSFTRGWADLCAGFHSRQANTCSELSEDGFGPYTIYEPAIDKGF
jgi:hypothetical protein